MNTPIEQQTVAQKSTEALDRLVDVFWRAALAEVEAKMDADEKITSNSNTTESLQSPTGSSSKIT